MNNYIVTIYRNCNFEKLKIKYKWNEMNLLDCMYIELEWPNLIS